MVKTVASRKSVPAPRPAPDPVSAWVSEGIISQEQADRIRARDGAVASMGATPPRPSMMPLVVEALGYLGGAIVVVATVLIANEYWDDLGAGTRVSLLGAAALALLAAGVIIPVRLEEMGARMRSVVWLVSTGALAGALGVWGSQVLDLHGADLAVLLTGGSAAYAWALHVVRPAVLQQVALMGLLGGTAAALLAEYDTESWPGVGLWVVGAMWILLGQTGLLRPVRLTRAGGAVMMLIGSMMTTSNLADAGIVFSLLTVALVVVLAVVFNDLVVLAIGSLGAVQAIGAAVNEWFPNSLAAAVALLVVGGGLVGAAIWIARRRTRRAQAE